MRWVFSDFMNSLLSSVFYVAESKFSGKIVLYYRKPVWALFRSSSMKKLIAQEQYKPRRESHVRQLLAQQQMGLSRLCLLPKETGVRPIATLCKREVLSLRPTAAPET